MRLARSPGHTYEGVARDLGIARESVRRWAKQADIDAVAVRLNGRPRKTLDYRTPAAMLAEAVASTD